MTCYAPSDVSRNVPHSFILMTGYELRCPSSQHGIEYLNIPVASNGLGLFDNHLAHVFNYPLFIQTLSLIVSLSIIQRSLLGNSTHMLNSKIAPFSICVSLVWKGETWRKKPLSFCHPPKIMTQCMVLNLSVRIVYWVYRVLSVQL